MITISDTDIDLAPPPAQDKNLDMVRNILVGEHARESDRRLASLERFVKVWTNSVRDEMRKNHDAVNHEIHLVHDLLAEESRARIGDTSNARKHYEQAGKNIDSLFRQMQHTQDAFAQRLEQQREDILGEIKKASEQLHNDKVDRKALAALLDNVTRQLAIDTV
jgi:hypothetical protein